MVEVRAGHGYGELVEAVRARRCILFAGAGLSMAVGLPSWSQLIEHMRRELDLADGVTDADYQTLAEYYRLEKGSIGALRSWMDRTWSVSEAKVARSRIHQLIVKLDFPILYTTNYDNNLEVAYAHAGRDFTKIVNARDLTRAEDGCTQIVKFHGDFEEDNSLILAETDYFDRLNFDSPLDVKFRADALGRTILFIGYSMSDLNIRLLLHKLWRTWVDSGRMKDRPPSFVFAARPDPVRDAVLGQWGITVLSNGERDPQKSLIKFLDQLAADVDPVD
ncbi:SIR2 family NAD-dependent protein deacylase [Sphingomonas sp.]|jgi:hypothetical protein|uniref:SIR2 family NAD-dependent protein deacylase n=1 Tax=Sphingomonas sp. TaxID=28214 RepID=UPI002DF6D453|nr:SIR2 family protein [Sphingomonas sp.]